MRRRAAPSVSIEHDPSNDCWRDAECQHHVGVVEFFPERGQSAREAKGICARCPVRADCLAYALRYDLHDGVWGGLSEQERQRLGADAHLSSRDRGAAGRAPSGAGQRGAIHRQRGGGPVAFSVGPGS
jgi:hypothetical protein